MNVAQKTYLGISLRARLAISLFCVAAFSSRPANAQQPCAKQEASSSTGSETGSKSSERATFVLKIISDGHLCPINNLDCEEKNIWWKNFILEASDGHTLHLTRIPFPSAKRSTEQFESRIKTAEKVIRRSPECDDKGEQVGERALGFFPGIKDSKPPWDVAFYRVIWTWGSRYWEITGEHLDDVLALEQRLNEEGVGAVWGWRSHVPLRP